MTLPFRVMVEESKLLQEGKSGLNNSKSHANY